MFPSQTSLIPIIVALVRFIEANGLKAFSLNYPYWYLGTTPFKYLAGPIIPTLLYTLHRLLPFVSLFKLSIYTIFFSFILSFFGWGLLIKKITQNKQLFLIVILLMIFLPWRIFSAITFGETTVIVAENFLPFVLWGLWNLLEKKSWKNWLVVISLISFLFLINTTIIPVLLVGMVAVSTSRSFENGKLKKVEGKLKISLIVFILSFILVTFWYSPHYWLTILFNPSIGGASTLEAAKHLIDFLKAGIPLVLAVLVVYFQAKIKDRLTIFASVWLLTFLFLTIFRFLGDPDFWMDWTSWLSELEIGLIILIASYFQSKKILLSISLCFLSFLTVFSVFKTINRPSLINKTLPRALQSLEKIKTGRVFLSGSTVFWFNALYDLPQVRGGVDQVSINPNWARLSYEIREGEDSQKTLEALKEMKVDYVLVHTDKSLEYYHDFKHLSKWLKIGQNVWQGNGDILYKISY